MMVLLIVLAMAFLAGCNTTNVSSGSDQPVFNESLNQELENLTMGDPAFQEFMFDYPQRNDSKYEIAETDVFTAMGEGFNASDISVLGIKIGDSYDDVIRTLGIPDVQFTSADKSYKNLEYSKRIGIGDKTTAITYHVENETVTMINMRSTFAKYLQGNTSIGTDKEVLYSLLNTPDYTDFTQYQRVLRYIEKGVDLYLRRDKLDIISIYEPKEFKGVKYERVLEEVAPGSGVYANVTRPVPIE